MVKGIHVLFNGKNEEDENVYNHLKESVNFLEDSYEWGIIVDIIMGALLSTALVILVLCKAYARFFSTVDDSSKIENEYKIRYQKVASEPEAN